MKDVKAGDKIAVDYQGKTHNALVKEVGRDGETVTVDVEVVTIVALASVPRQERVHSGQSCWRGLSEKPSFAEDQDAEPAPKKKKAKA